MNGNVRHNGEVSLTDLEHSKRDDGIYSDYINFDKDTSWLVREGLRGDCKS